MAKKSKFEKRDWLIGILFVLVILTNWVWYEHAKSQDTTNRNDTSAWIAHQVEINKLQACINNNQHHCDINPGSN